MVDQAPIDRAVFNSLLESVGGGREFLGKLPQAYFNDLAKLLATPYAALATSNTQEFRRVAYRLKSSSPHLGAMALSRLSKRLEEMGEPDHCSPVSRWSGRYGTGCGMVEWWLDPDRLWRSEQPGFDLKPK